VSCCSRCLRRTRRRRPVCLRLTRLSICPAQRTLRPIRTKTVGESASSTQRWSSAGHSQVSPKQGGIISERRMVKKRHNPLCHLGQERQGPQRSHMPLRREGLRLVVILFAMTVSVEIGNPALVRPFLQMILLVPTPLPPSVCVHSASLFSSLFGSVLPAVSPPLLSSLPLPPGPLCT
jgi:hypothetical protein